MLGGQRLKATRNRALALIPQFQLHHSHETTVCLDGLRAALGDSLELGRNILLEKAWEMSGDGRTLGLPRNFLWANGQRPEHQDDINKKQLWLLQRKPAGHWSLFRLEK